MFAVLVTLNFLDIFFWCVKIIAMARLEPTPKFQRHPAASTVTVQR